MDNSPNNRFQGTLHKVSGPLNRDVQHENMKTLGIITLAIACISCRGAPPMPNSQVLPSNPEIETRAILATSNEYKAAEYWDNLRSQIDFTSETDTIQWLTLQQSLLTNTLVPQSIQRSAIQEFYIHFEQAKAFSDWLSQAHEAGIFSDPFIKQNLEMTLTVLDKARNNISAEQGGAGYPPQSVGSPDP